MRTVGKILGALGLVLLLTSPFTYFFVTGQGLISASKAALGVALIGVFFLTNWRQLGQFATGRSTFFFVSSVAMGVLLLGSLTAVNFIAAKRDKTWDLTKKQIHSLSPQTTSTLSGLKEKVKAVAFIAAESPAYGVWEELFKRYRSQAPEQFDYTFKDPRKNPDLAGKYQVKEGQLTVVVTRGEGDKESHAAVPAPTEQELTQALLKLNQVGEQKVYLTSGHGEWPVEPKSASPEAAAESLSDLKRSLIQEGYAPEVLSLVGKEEVPRDAALVIVAGPRTPFGAPEVKALRKYLDEGGRLLYFTEPNTDAGEDMAKLLADYGFALDPGTLVDDRVFNRTPYFLVSAPPFYKDHELTRPLTERQLNLMFLTARGITVRSEGTLPGVKAEPVITTSPFAWEESLPNDDPQRSPGERTGNIPLVAASTRSTASAQNKRFDEARVVVFGDSETLVNAGIRFEANRNLVLNALGWGSNQVSKITLRPPDRDISSLDMDEKLMGKIRFVATDLFPLSLLGVGLAIWFTRRSK